MTRFRNQRRRNKSRRNRNYRGGDIRKCPVCAKQSFVCDTNGGVCKCKECGYENGKGKD